MGELGNQSKLGMGKLGIHADLTREHSTQHTGKAAKQGSGVQHVNAQRQCVSHTWNAITD